MCSICGTLSPKPFLSNTELNDLRIIIGFKKSEVPVTGMPLENWWRMAYTRLAPVLLF